VPEPGYRPMRAVGREPAPVLAVPEPGHRPMRAVRREPAPVLAVPNPRDAGFGRPMPAGRVPPAIAR
jgi:hypothetical protein